jgi:hypothetical protein
MTKKKPKPPKYRPLSILPETIDALDEMDSADARTAAIVGLAFLENNLALAIMVRLRDMDEREQKNFLMNHAHCYQAFPQRLKLDMHLIFSGSKFDLISKISIVSAIALRTIYKCEILTTQRS